MQEPRSIFPDPALRLINRWGPIALGVLFLLILIRTAWLCDDAYITYRSIDNAMHGYGLRFNVEERVQSYTHPLWMMLHLPVRLLISDMYVSGMVVSLGVSLVTMAFAGLKLAPGKNQLAFIFLAAVMSRSFMDYSTSGLENPLTHLLLGIFAWIWLDRPEGRRRLLGLALVTGLMLTNRMDTLLLVGPALGLAFWRERSWRNVRTVAIGLLPFLVWEMFSVVYYGFPFPNTAYAKLNHGFESSLMWEQGWYYLVNCISRDPITLISVFGAAMLAFVYRQKHLIPLAIGMLLYILYVVKIGGGFMSGRFFTGPFFMSLIILVRMDVFPKLAGDMGRLLALTVLVGWLPGNPTLLSGSGYTQNKEESIDQHGIADERAFYYQGTGLLHVGSGRSLPDFRWVEDGRKLAASPDRVHVVTNMGFVGFYAGPEKLLVDHFALTDPLLARIPNLYMPDWRPGHFGRMIPPGYKRSLETGENQLRDPALKVLYDDLKLVTRGPLFSKARWQAIWRLNRGIPQSQVNRESYFLPIAKEVRYEDFKKPQKKVQKWDSPENVIMTIDSGLRVVLPEGLDYGSVSVRVCNRCWYVAVLRRAKKRLYGFLVNGHGNGGMSLRTCTELPPDLKETPPDELLIYPLTEWRLCSFSDIQFGGECEE